MPWQLRRLLRVVHERRIPRAGWFVGTAGLCVLVVLFFGPSLRTALRDAPAPSPLAGFALAWAFDESGALSHVAVAAGALDDAFRPGPNEELHLGFSAHPLWLRLSIRNPAEARFDGALVYKFPYLDRIDAWVPQADGSVRHVVKGDSVPLSDPWSYSHFPAFPVSVAAGGEAVAYIRVQSSSVLMAPLVLRGVADFERANLRDQILLAALFGAVGAVCLYVLTVYLTVRDKAYLDFIPFSLTYALYVAVSTGIGQVWLWPHAFADANMLYFIVQGLLFASGVRFFQRYMRMRTSAPRLDNVMRVFLFAGLLTTVSPFLPSPVDKLLIAFVAGPGAVFVLGVAVWLWVRGVPGAQVVTVGWAFSHITSVFLYLRIFDISPYTPFNHYLVAFGCAIATLYFALALALGLRRQQEKLLLAEAVNDTRSQFLAGMSHELRTPLNAIMGFSEMMKEQMLGPLSPPVYREYAADIHESSRNMLRLIDDVLDISKIESGQYSLSREPVDLVALTGQTVDLLRPVAGESDIRVDVEMAVREAPVDADRKAMLQALFNVLHNAVRFNRPGGSITAGVAVADDEVRISIADTGIGIAEKDLERIVRPFELVRSNAYTTKSGAGLGLPLARMLVELQGGRLAVRSREGEGTEVTISLPARPPKRRAAHG